MKGNLILVFGLILTSSVLITKAQTEKAIVTDQLIFEEKDGLVAIEAEYFYKQTKSDIRRWYLTSTGNIPTIKPDLDPEHTAGASNGAYIEVLPDTRVTHADKLIKFGDSTLTAAQEKEINFSDLPGQVAVLHYKVNIHKPGRYYVWVRAFSTGGEDNGLHVGLNDTWPEHGQRMQWCEGKNQWTWDSKQRTEAVHCGVAKEIYLDIDKAGVHDIQFSMREDGFEMDKLILTDDINYIPEGEGPTAILFKGKLPASFTNVEAPAAPQNKLASYFEQVAKTVHGNQAMAAKQFPVDGTNYYIDNNWLAINPDQHKEAKTSTSFPFDNGMYDIVFVGVGENDGQSSFQLFVNDKELGNYSPPLSKSSFEEGIAYNKLWENIGLKKGDRLTVISKIGSKDGQEYSRARWSGIIFAPSTQGKEILEKAKTFSIKQNVGSAQEINGQVQTAK